MLFNNYIFILAFFPIVVFAYFVSNKISYTVGKAVLIFTSIFFYAYNDLKSLLILGLSVLFNYIFSVFIYKFKWKKLFLFIPIAINISLLLVFKYEGSLMLPLGISFFTFQQIAYIVSVYRGDLSGINVIDYLLFITYFPKVLMGPLTEPADFIYQINDSENKKIKWNNLAQGMKIFSFGLFKKVLIADTFSKAVGWGFINFEVLSGLDTALVMLFYTFELYFDFSGYCDMAVGVSTVLGIKLPINFDSPYKSLSIREFWKRWHMSLTGFLTRYVYIPLGGSKKGKVFTYVNIMIVFIISGIWHGDNLTFVLWGGLHGVFMVLDRMFEKAENKVFIPIRWIVTFGIVNVLWLLFRADSIGQWMYMLRRICTFSRELNPEIALQMGLSNAYMVGLIVAAMFICLVPENNYRKNESLKLTNLVTAAAAFICGLLFLSRESVFLYFNF